MNGPATDPPIPWKVQYDGEVLDVDHGGESRWPWRIVDGNDDVIVDFMGGEDVSEEVAHILAAAGEMKGALEDIIHAIDHDQPLGNGHALREIAAFALKRAEVPVDDDGYDPDELPEQSHIDGCPGGTARHCDQKGA